MRTDQWSKMHFQCFRSARSWWKSLALSSLVTIIGIGRRLACWCSGVSLSPWKSSSCWLGCLESVSLSLSYSLECAYLYSQQLCAVLSSWSPWTYGPCRLGGVPWYHAAMSRAITPWSCSVTASPVVSHLETVSWRLPCSTGTVSFSSWLECWGSFTAMAWTLPVTKTCSKWWYRLN